MLLNLNLDRPSKKVVYSWSNSYEIKVMIISLIEMIELRNFGYMTTSFKSRDVIKIVGDVKYRDYDVITFVSKYICFKKT